MANQPGQSSTFPISRRDLLGFTVAGGITGALSGCAAVPGADTASARPVSARAESKARVERLLARLSVADATWPSRFDVRVVERASTDLMMRSSQIVVTQNLLASLPMDYQLAALLAYEVGLARQETGVTHASPELKAVGILASAGIDPRGLLHITRDVTALTSSNRLPNLAQLARDSDLLGALKGKLKAYGYVL